MARRLTAEKAQERREAKSQRKVEQLIRMDAVSGAGMSLIQKLEQELLSACKEYLRYKESAFGAGPDLQHNLNRGTIRGLAIGVAMIRAPYELADNRAKTLKAVEAEFIRKAKNNGTA